MDRKLGTKRGVIEVKADGDAGKVIAAFSKLNVIDLDGDVTLAGAFGAQDVRIAQWGHNWGDLPVGRGKVYEQGNEALLDGSFFLDTDHGRNTFQTVKGLADLQEWSYGFDVEEYSIGEFEGQTVRFLRKLKVHEVSPVMLGAGIGTHTVDIKGLERAGLPFATHADLAAASLAEVKAMIDRAESLAGLRAKEGRTFSAANLEKLTALAGAMADALGQLETLLASGKPSSDDDDAKAFSALASEYARFVQHNHA